MFMFWDVTKPIKRGKLTSFNAKILNGKGKNYL